MKKHFIAFVTSQEFPNLLEDDLLLVRALERANVSVTPAVWDDKSINWNAFDLVIIRSPWDYYLKPEEYKLWIKQFIDSETRLLNPPQSILDNIDKRYLLDFEKNGIPIIPTELIKAGSNSTLKNTLNKMGWDNVVIKPAISAGAYGTWRSNLKSAKEDQEKYSQQLAREDLLIQPFMPEIQNEGEYSVIYFNAEYSHSVLKKAKGNDFRIQEEHGGTTESIEPSRDILKQTQKIIDLQNEKLLYTRVDGVIREGQFLLMELEINEPSLFFEFDELAPEKCAQAIINRLN